MKIFKMTFTLLITLALSSLVGPSYAALGDPLTIIELDTPVHFLAPDGSDLLIEAGTYSVEPAKEWIRVMSGERRDAVLIEAKKGTHELELEQTMALSVPGESEEEKDNHHVILLLPNGESLDATGTYSGIRARGFFQKTVNSVKKKANNTYKKARATGRKAGKTVKKAALHTKREVEKTGRRVSSNFKSGIQKARQTVSGGSVQWTRLSQIAGEAARQEALAWLRQAYIDSRRCKVMAVTAIGTPGVLKSRYTFQGKIAKALIADGASKTIAQGWDKAFKESWEQWAKNVTIPGLPFYPAFGTFPGPTAPPMANVPFPLTTMPSSGLAAMTPPRLSRKVLANIGNVAKSPKVKSAVNVFATELGGRFAQCMASCMVMNVMGSGPIPTFAPPIVPTGPVQNGTCRGGRISGTAAFINP